MALNNQVAWLKNQDVVSRPILDENILINIKTNRLLRLNDQGIDIWKMLNKSRPTTTAEITRCLTKRYHCPSIEQLHNDIHAFLSFLRDKDFIYTNDSDNICFNIANSAKNDALNLSSHFSFSENLHHKSALHNIPISSGIEITQRCNMRCVHCYIGHLPSIQEHELSTKDMCHLLDKIAEKGCPWLLITGGEPLIREDFSEIYQHAKKLGMIITVFTSATTINEKDADLFCQFPPLLIESTLHGANRKTFDAITNVPGSYHRFLSGVKILKERNIPFHLKMIIMQQNWLEVEEACRLAYDLGAGDFRFDPMVNADFQRSYKEKSLRIKVENAISLDLLGPFRERWNRVFKKALSDQSDGATPSNLLFPCRAGKCSFTISCDGYLMPCVLMRDPSYDLRKLEFGEAWEKLNHYTTSEQMREDNLCRECRAQTCSKCPAWGFLEHGDPNTKSHFACSLQLEREKVFLS